MEEIPKIIHQVWSEIHEPLPDYYLLLTETWKEQYPEWRYEFWNEERMNHYVETHYPEYWDAYNRYPYNAQRWDAIRYLVLNKMGGMYVDIDYESLEPMDTLLAGKSCCFAMEPQSHCKLFNRKVMFNSALMASIPAHPFVQKILKRVFSEEIIQYRAPSKDICVWSTTGPWGLIDLYEQSSEIEKASVYLIPDKYVTPFDVMQARQVRAGVENEALENCLKDAYAVHYFFGSWLMGNND